MNNELNIRKLIIPLIFEQLLAVSVGMVDTFMVSTVGEVAVSGVALVDNINRLVIQILSAFAAGGIVVSSQYYGGSHIERAKKNSAQLETLMTIVATVSGILCAVFSRQILGAIFGAVDADVMEAANTYMVITALSYPFLGLYNANAAVFRSFGNSKISIYISVIMNLVNIGFNALFVFGFHMGVAGIGYATLLSRVAAGILMKLIALTKKNVLKTSAIKDYLPKAEYIGKILKIGIPGGIENGMFQIGKLLVVSMIAGLGTNAIAANSIAYQVIDFPNIPGVAIGLALVTVIGNDVGAGDIKRAKKDTKKLLRYAYIGDWCCKITLFVLAPAIVSVFSLSKEATDICVMVLRCFSVASLPVWPLSFTMPSALRGAGDAAYTMIVGIFSMWLGRIVISYILIFHFELGVLGVWIGMFADWYIRGICYTARFLSGKWQQKKVV